MKKILFSLTFVILLFVSCSQEEEQKASYTFDKSKIEKCDSIDRYIISDVALDMSKTKSILNEITLSFYKDDIYISSLANVLRFGKDGSFKNEIGRLGHSADEYIEFLDYCLDSIANNVDILGLEAIYTYDRSGKFIGKKPLSIPATSFTKTKQYYWFSTGRNGYDKYSLFRTNHELKDIQKYIETPEVSVPIKESNFGKGTVLTFKESFTHDIYRIDNGDVKFSYKFDFLDSEIPDGMFEGDVMTLADKMSKNQYAMIRTYLENDRFIFMFIHEYHEDIEDAPSFYWWIINKTTNKDIVLSVSNEDIWLLGNPQVLNGNNILYLVGYTDKKQNDINPHVIGIDLSKMQSLR